MNRQLIVILCIVALDAVGIGLIFPILPGLLKEMTASADISLLYGVILALYALMQFVFSPVLGALSDRYGRRPVLLLSIAGATVDYVFMALSPIVAVLLIGRAIAGITSANMAVATAYISDITEKQQRAERFGDIHLRAPFAVAAVLNAVNLGLAFFMLPETRSRNTTRLTMATLNPLAPMRWAFGLTMILPMLGMFVLFGLIGNIPGTVWVLYGQDKFQWNGMMVGLSLASFGAWHAGSQAFLTGPLTARFGETRTIVLGILSDVVAFVSIALATRGWMVFVLAPFFALSGVAMPALQALMSREVSEDRQGELQGVLASLMSLTAIVGPLIGTAVYFYSRTRWIGAVWILGALLYLGMIPLLVAHRRRATRAVEEG